MLPYLTLSNFHLFNCRMPSRKIESAISDFNNSTILRVWLIIKKKKSSLKLFLVYTRNIFFTIVDVNYHMPATICLPPYAYSIHTSR